MMAKIVLVPTSHIARESLKRVRTAVRNEKPDCIAVELDRNRYHTMRMEQSISSFQMLRQLGISTWLVYVLFRKIQRSLGKRVNIFPGAEMLGAVRIASEKRIRVAFIDQDIRVTFMNMKGCVGTWEKLRLVWFVVKGISIGWIYHKIKGKSLLDLSRVPPEKLIDKAMAHLRKHFPNIHRILVAERDLYMANNLKALSREFGTIVAVIGAGHKRGMERMLKPKKRRSRQRPRGRA